jgi:NADH:ubiquinone oxidoreductase subunit 4 (subunit M)
MNVYILLFNPVLIVNFFLILLLHSIVVGLNFYIFGGLIVRLHIKNYKQTAGVLNTLVKFNSYILITILIYGAFPVTAVFISEYIIGSVVLKNNTIFITLILSLIFSLIFIKLLHVYLTMSSSTQSYKKTIPDLSTIEIVCFYAFVLILVFILLI